MSFLIIKWLASPLTLAINRNITNNVMELPMDSKGEKSWQEWTWTVLSVGPWDARKALPTTCTNHKTPGLLSNVSLWLADLCCGNGT